MSFSLKEYWGNIPLELQGSRRAAFEAAMSYAVQKRDWVWLEHMKYHPHPIDSVSPPEGWSAYTEPFKDDPAYKNEKSVFYWLQHALYHQAFIYTLSAGQKVTLVLPTFASSEWPLLFIRLEDRSVLTIVDERAFLNGSHQPEFTPFRSVVVHCGAHSTLHWKGFQHHANEVISFDHKRFVLGSSAELKFYNHILGGSRSFDETVVELFGAGSRVESQTVFFGHQHEHQEIRSSHVHIGKDTYSKMISKGAVKDHAHSGFLGYIQMEPGCSGADGDLQEHNLLLSSTSKIDAVPGLEIGHNDVAASHAAYMERVDEEKLFYLASRGIPESEAVQLIIEGFFWDAIQKMGDEVLEKIIFDRILSRVVHF